MKKLLFIFCAIVCSIVVKAQSCAPPEFPTIFIDINGSSLYWDVPVSECEILYFEVEFNSFPFTPGMGEGFLVSPVFFAPLDNPNFFEYAWVRSVCDCEGGPGGEGDGEPDTNSGWVEASLNVTVYPDPGLFCSDIPVPVATANDCGNLSDGLQEMNFIAIFEFDGSMMPLCADGMKYLLWRSFDAPSSGSVSIGTGLSEFGPYTPWNDMGVMVGSSCGQGDLLCVGSMNNDESQMLTGLTPGMTYYVGVWANGFEFFWDGGNGYNGVSTVLHVCEIEGEEDFSINLDDIIFADCPNGEEEPQFELGSSWDSSAEVEVTFTQAGPCGSILYFIQVSDSAGNSTSAEQELVFTDNMPPVMNCPDTLWYVVTGDVMSEMPDLTSEIAIEAGACDTPYTWTQTPIPGSIVGQGIFPAEVSVSDPCGNTAVCEVTIFMDFFTGTRENPSTAIGLFPNPAKHQIGLSLVDELVDPRFEIVDISGRVVKEMAMNSSGVHFMLDVSGLTTGLYHLRVWKNNGKLAGVSKFIVE